MGRGRKSGLAHGCEGQVPWWIAVLLCALSWAVWPEPLFAHLLIVLLAALRCGHDFSSLRLMLLPDQGNSLCCCQWETSLEWWFLDLSSHQISKHYWCCLSNLLLPLCLFFTLFHIWLPLTLVCVVCLLRMRLIPEYQVNRSWPSTRVVYTSSVTRPGWVCGCNQSWLFVSYRGFLLKKFS